MGDAVTREGADRARLQNIIRDAMYREDMLVTAIGEERRGFRPAPGMIRLKAYRDAICGDRREVRDIRRKYLSANEEMALLCDGADRILDANCILFQKLNRSPFGMGCGSSEGGDTHERV